MVDGRHRMFIGCALFICLLSVPVFDGRLGHLADLRFRAGALAVGALVAQVLIISVVPGGDGALHQVVHLATYALLAAFLWVNRSVPYLWLAAGGGALNLLVIASNGGIMPADPDALATAGVEQVPGEFANSTVLAHPHLSFLGDVFAVPASWPVSNVFSVGDAVIVVAALLALHTLCDSRLSLPRFATVAGRRSPA
ncbi:MAG: DUF5317 domain-containing protein [Solirubrobacteraceae bacterium]